MSYDTCLTNLSSKVGFGYGCLRKIMVAGGSPAALRAEAARLAQGWSALARWAYGGKALLLDHPVNRLSREIWQYGVAGLRPADLEMIYP